MFRLFAELIAFHLNANSRYAAKQAQIEASEAGHADSRRELVASEARFAGSQASLATSKSDFAVSQEKLVDALAIGELREQFIAVLGHDLRNPVASVTSGVRVLEKTVVNQKGIRVLRLMGESLGKPTVKAVLR